MSHLWINCKLIDKKSTLYKCQKNGELVMGPTQVAFKYIIIIMSCRRHGYPRPSLTTSPYCSSPLAGLQGHIPYPHIAAGCMFRLVVLLLPGHMWGSIGVHHLWARPCFKIHYWLIFDIPLNKSSSSDVDSTEFPDFK